jgi:predicted nuclease of restriction endonuclease-like (RecB) superfamily
MDNLTKYGEGLIALKEKIRQAQMRAILTVNTELLGIYWEIGKLIAEQKAVEGWGGKVIDRLSEDLRREFPEMQGFSPRNLRYMESFHLAYPVPFLQPPAAKLELTEGDQENETQNIDFQDITFLQPLVAKLPWAHHMIILDRVKKPEDRVFYMQQCVQHGWSKGVLQSQIETKLHKRLGKSINNFAATLPQAQSELVEATNGVDGGTRIPFSNHS